MKRSIRYPVLALLAVFGCAAHGATPPGVAVTPAITLQGGSSSALKWSAPLTSAYKVHVFTPKGAAIPNALYRVYPKGKRAGSTSCLSTDTKYPCYEVTVDQTQHANAWTQLTLNGDPATQWNFAKSTGYVTLVASNLATTSLLSASTSIRFENQTIVIGKPYAGGIIFYVDSSGSHGLVAATSDQSLGVWYNGSNITGVTATAVGKGETNTAAIISQQGTGSYAASIAGDLVLNGYSDWFLPSKDELNLMYTNIGPGAAAPLTNVGGFGNGYYWSSSEYSSTDAWYQFFGFTTIFQGYYPKYYTFSVRAVRAF